MSTDPKIRSKAPGTSLPGAFMIPSRKAGTACADADDGRGFALFVLGIKRAPPASGACRRDTPVRRERAARPVHARGPQRPDRREICGMDRRSPSGPPYDGRSADGHRVLHRAVPSGCARFLRLRATIFHTMAAMTPAVPHKYSPAKSQANARPAWPAGAFSRMASRTVSSEMM